ncbi:MAG: hypothetical protein HETSPECPRED_006224 [Heterodermia speciosa]|uniref:DUF3074 domain-containing protein n=1 Tax=Heterodermia speciosa TaxID=116794 RepID=A0A8H3FMB5_9LECA|nr:MAG: hypothetical protein HETSPECPRED_006224 [Heterodermia speciosa]
MPLGNLVRLIPLKLNEIPSHPSVSAYLNASTHKKHDSDSDFSKMDLSSSDGTSPNLDPNGQPLLIPFIREILDEATNFVDNELPSTFTKKGTKSNPPATAKIELLQRMIGSEEISRIPFERANIPRKAWRVVQGYEEAWFSRKSTHANKPETGTATWEEFDSGLRVQHSEHEREYTPDVLDSFKVLDWNAETDALGDEVGEYRDVKMSIYEMSHKLPFPLLPRVFPVLIITSRTGAGGFIVVQIPINLKALPESFYSSGRNQTQGDTSVKRKRPVLGVYTSIERGILRDSKEIEWIMATASDAKGVLPMWAQKLGVPGAVVNDVGFFMKWTADNRAKKAG